MANPWRPKPIWVSLFSQTGSELQAIVDHVGRPPNVVLYNGKEPDKISFRYKDYPGHLLFLNKPHNDCMEWLRKSYPDDNIRSMVTITLHGYLRIIPPDICNRYRIYNGHPGAIDLYPDLKGKDPQVRAWENKDSYANIGSVIHEVTEGVDEGKIVKSVHFRNRVESLDEMYDTLKKASLSSWIFFMEEKKICG